ncbi:hypothetical protein [Phaeocystidibacter luteus]|uniref:Uncharacterized protein n=1 Tax=Phaeocystidibacter luteus TaxID=911197 RepID=A0A6N6RHV9_9FLAO|nr:hypothetical protein [Phaeocystidibacter luteus]KAB2813902.1 hypothetical protein F8C67_04250 [Phaeocystidibacter luteus]
MKNLNYAIWAVLLAEVIAFGDMQVTLHVILALFLFLMMIFRFFAGRSNKWGESVERFNRANPLNPKLYTAILVVFSLIAIYVPYQSGVIPVPLYFLIGMLWFTK